MSSIQSLNDLKQSTAVVAFSIALFAMYISMDNDIVKDNYHIYSILVSIVGVSMILNIASWFVSETSNVIESDSWFIYFHVGSIAALIGSMGIVWLKSEFAFYTLLLFVCLFGFDIIKKAVFEAYEA